MTSAPTPRILPRSPVEEWHAILKTTLVRLPALPEELVKRMRGAKLTFGNRVHCPFLRPFFLSPEDEQRVRIVAETMAEIAERVANTALNDSALLAQFLLRDHDLRMLRLGNTAGPSISAARYDALYLP